jgi:hypothetical protein
MNVLPIYWLQKVSTQPLTWSSSRPMSYFNDFLSLKKGIWTTFKADVFLFTLLHFSTAIAETLWTQEQRYTIRFLKKKNQKSSRSYIQMKPVYIHTHIPFYRVRVFPTRDTSCALAAWRSRHSIRLRNRRLGFETRQGIRCLGRTLNCCCVYVIDLLCIFVCLLDK